MAMFTRRSDKAEALRAVPLFAGFSKKHLMEVARHVDELILPAGDILTKEGEIAREALLVVKGNVAVLREGRQVATRGAGDMFGEMSLIDHHPHSSTCVAEDECVVLVMSSRDFSALIATLPEMARQVMMTLSRRLRESDHKLDECLG